MCFHQNWPATMKIGDKIEIVSIPEVLPDDDLRTRPLLERCVGRVFPIVGFHGELLELEVGEVLGEPSYMHSIWIEPEHVELTKDYGYDISLRFFHPSIDPAVITAALCLKPSWAWRAGEPRLNRKGEPLRDSNGTPLKGVRRESYWVASISKGESVEKHLRAAISEALDQLLPHRDFLHRIRLEGGRSEFFIGWYLQSNSGDVFDCDLLAILADMKVDLHLDIYP